MKFIKVKNRRGFNYDHGTEYSVIDLNRSTEHYNYEAGVNRIPRRDSKYRRYDFLVWDNERNEKVH